MKQKGDLSGFANDPLNEKLENARIKYDPKLSKYFLYATTDIGGLHEILISYGPEYWWAIYDKISEQLQQQVDTRYPGRQEREVSSHGDHSSDEEEDIEEREYPCLITPGEILSVMAGIIQEYDPDLTIIKESKLIAAIDQLKTIDTAGTITKKQVEEAMKVLLTDEHGNISPQGLEKIQQALTTVGI